MNTTSLDELTSASAAPTAAARGATTGRGANATRRLLACDLVAGPIYVAVGATEVLARPGFDIRKHSLSIMANGDWGWVHSAMLTTTGLLTVAGAIGLGRALAPGRGATWGPRLLGLYGAGVALAGLFRADPALGFPPGTPADYVGFSWHGVLHLVFGGIGFLGLIAACLILARRFAGRGERGWAAFSLITGVSFFVAFAGITTGSQGPISLAFYAAVALTWAWLTALTARQLADPTVAD